ncbi:MAG: ABC transporter ATP-binding protein [Candidatus Babeliales bacterium]
MRYKAIIFDMDGTIVQTEHLWHQATCKLFENRGHQLTQTQKDNLAIQFMGAGLPHSCRIIKDMLGTPDSIEIIMKEKLTFADQLYEQGISFVDGFIEFHQKVIAIPLKVGVATNATLHTVQRTECSLNLSSYFGPHVYTINHVHNRGKPDPAIYVYAATQLGIAPEECIAIEDSAHGILSAKAAGMLSIGINTSKKPDQIKEAHLRVDHYNQIDLAKILGPL